MRFRIEGFDSNLHIDAEFALCDTGCCDSKKIHYDPTYDNFSMVLNYFEKIAHVSVVWV